MGIDLKGRIPIVTNPLSARLIYLAAGVFLFAAIAVGVGFYKSAQKKEAATEHRQAQTVASEAATSNRTQVEGGQPGYSPLPSSIPALPPSPATVTALPLPAGQVPTAVVPGSQAVAIQPLPYSAPATYQPPPQTPYAYPATAPVVDTREQLRLQMASRLQEREQQAIEGPTGIQDQHQAVSTPIDPAQAQIAQLESLMRQAQPQANATPGMQSYPGALRSAESASSDQNGQSDKRRFAEGETAGDYQKAVRTLPLSRWVVQRGTVIPASLPQQVVSDLPGDLIAEVVRDVYDSPTQKFVEIPAGSRLVGEYNSGISYGQNRVQIVWTAIYFPDGTFIDLDRMPSHAADGSTGLKDKTNNHYKRLIAGVALTSLLSAGLQVSQNRTNGSVLSYPSTGQVIASGVGTQASQLGEQLTQRNMNIQPTLKIRPGEIFSVSVKKDILFQGPYTPMEVK